MLKLNSKYITLKQILTILLSISPIYSYIITSSNTIDTIFIKLDPYISILDKDNPFRYNISDLFPLVNKVATKFSKLYIELSHLDLLQETSLSNLPLAIAHHNNITSNLSAPLEIWLAYNEVFTTKNVSTLASQQVQDKLLSVVNEANSIFKGTITTLLISQYNHIKFANLFRNVENLKIGTLIDVNKNCNDTTDKEIYLTVPKLIFLPNEFSKKNPTILKAGQNQIEKEFQSILKRVTAKCKKYLSEQPHSPTFIFSFSDTNTSGHFNKTRLVSLWNQAEYWSRSTETPVILSKAFDTPYETSVHEKTNGWWRLVEDATYKSTTEYVFEEKLTISNETELEENFINFTWLRQDTQFDREYTGIIFNLYNKVGSSLATYTDQELQTILNQMENYFSKAIILVQDNTFEWLEILPKEIRNLDKIKTKIEATLMILPDVELHQYLTEPLDTLVEGFQLPKDLLTNFILPYSGSNTIDRGISIKSNLLEGKNLTEYRFGYLFPIKVCRIYDSKANVERDSIEQTFKDPDSQIIYFYFEEDEETVKLGARRMYHQRIVEFQECQKIVNRLNSEIFNNVQKELRFIMLHYATNSAKFYENAWAIQTLAKYWELLSNWAGSTKTTVVLSSAVDGTRIFKGKGIEMAEVGWWRQLVNSTGSVVGAQVNRIWLNKKEDALQIATDTLKRKTNNLNSSFGTAVDIFVVILLPLLGCGLIIALALYLMRGHYRSTILKESEIDYFFLGNNNLDENQPDTNAHKVPYDKERYEIRKGKFLIDENSVLGSGEFGKVCKGKVEMDNGITINVAVKLANPAKIHKTTLNGMLSEIKVLAYLGKNDNVIELIGANTDDLKNGKVMIFLELCQLGSLEKHLRKLRPSIDSETSEEFNSEKLGFDERYTNLLSMKKVNLDQELSNDLYRWSREICNGMAFLAEKHVVHADLATRNVLLNLRKEAKLCDFGLSRKLYNYTNYVKKQQEPLPWKWMSPEALRLLEFNEKSDVWAFGVTMWEIYSLGDTPYPGLSYDLSFAQMLESGFRLSEPKFDDKEMHAVMKKCWFTNPARRPTFSDLLKEFKDN